MLLISLFIDCNLDNYVAATVAAAAAAATSTVPAQSFGASYDCNSLPVSSTHFNGGCGSNLGYRIPDDLSTIAVNNWSEGTQIPTQLTPPSSPPQPIQSSSVHHPSFGSGQGHHHQQQITNYLLQFPVSLKIGKWKQFKIVID